MTSLTLFYDGTCPLCVKEMTSLRKHDKDNRVTTIDINSADFADYPHIDASKANRVLHALDENGTLWLGLDATHKAWQLVGKGWLYAPLRWRFIKPWADKGYLFFARHRYRISYLLTGRSRCSSNRCSR